MRPDTDNIDKQTETPPSHEQMEELDRTIIEITECIITDDRERLVEIMKSLPPRQPSFI